MNISEALAAWRALIGEEYVVTDDAVRTEAETATFLTVQKIPAIIRPGDRNELQECLRVANRFRVCVYPISAGKNWGYGSRVPPADGCVVIGLDRLNRIIDFDEQLAYLTVEPGVTFAAANRYLRERRSELILSSPGSTAEASIIGNLVERGISGGLNGERAGQVCNLEVVLPTGERIETGFGRFDKSVAKRVFAPGVGPELDGLFIQSNLGIVTRLTIWLTPLPRFFQYFSFAVRTGAQLAKLVNTLQEIKRAEVVDTNFGLYNDYKLLTYLRQFPRDRSPDKRLEAADLTANYRASLQGCAWFGEAAITAPSDEIGVAKRSLLMDHLQPHTDLLTFDEVGSENALVGMLPPTSLASVYWRKRRPARSDLDPDRDRVGLIWVCPVTRFRGDSVSSCVSLIEETMRAFPFEPIIGIQFHNMRAGHVIASILYDRDAPGHDERALACHDRLFQVLNENGFIPYRLSTRGMTVRLPSSASYAALLRSLKAAVDPLGILAPGRYE